MIEQEPSLIMRCDGCKDILVDGSGKIVRFFDHPYAYKLIVSEAVKLGWKCEDCCLCPICRKEI